MKKVLIVDEMHESIVPLLTAIGLEADYQPDITPPEITASIHLYDGMVIRSKMRITKDLLDRTERLRFIARAGAGVDEIDEAYLQQKRITLLNAPEGNRDAVGEHALAMLLCLMNKLHTGDQEVRQGLWLREKNRGMELLGRTVGIIGYGNMGRAFAQRLRGFGCNVLAYDKYKTNYENQDARQASLQEIFDYAQVLSLHIPLNEENRHMVSEAFLDCFKNPIFLVNLARGEVVPFKSVKYGLDKGILLGAALDVLENEKFETYTPNQKELFSALAQSGKVLFSPHVGGWSVESYQKINQVLTEKIKHLLAKG